MKKNRTEISPGNQDVIADYLGHLYEYSESLRRALLHATGESRTPTREELLDSSLGFDLWRIANAAEGRAEWNETYANDVAESCARVLTLTWERPGMIGTGIPPAFWQYGVGRLLLLASVWCSQDALINLTEAGKILGKSVQAISQMVIRGRLESFQDPDEPNPQKATRVRRSHVEALKKEKNYLWQFVGVKREDVS